MSELKLETNEEAGRVALAPRGWIDISNVGGLVARFEAELARPDLQALAIDLSEAEYIDSATVSALIRAKSLAEDRRRGFCLIGVVDQARRVLEETHLLPIFLVLPDRETFRTFAFPATRPTP